MENEDRSRLISEISSLLSQCQLAHRQYEIERLNGERDEDWPKWYAGYLLEHGLPELLHRQITRDELAERLDQLLTLCDTSHRTNAPREKWEDYYARYLLEIL